MSAIEGSLYWSNYKVDIASIVSITSLAVKIFRLLFQFMDINVLRRNPDSFIRQSYFPFGPKGGGAIEVVKNRRLMYGPDGTVGKG